MGSEYSVTVAYHDITEKVGQIDQLEKHWSGDDIINPPQYVKEWCEKIRVQLYNDAKAEDAKDVTDLPDAPDVKSVVLDDMRFEDGLGTYGAKVKCSDGKRYHCLFSVLAC